MSGTTLDAGALICFEKADRFVGVLIDTALKERVTISIPAGVLAQVWRDGARQVRLARLVASKSVEVVPLDAFEARAAGQLCGVSRTTDIVDASVVTCARLRGHAVVTSDPDDLLRIDARLTVIPV